LRFQTTSKGVSKDIADKDDDDDYELYINLCYNEGENELIGESYTTFVNV